MNPLHWLADRLLLRAPGYAHLYVRVHRLGFVRGWTCCLLAMAGLYSVVRVVGWAL